MGGRDYFSGLRRSALRVVDAEAPTRLGRRHFFRAVALHGASIPVVHFALSSSFGGEIGSGLGSARLPASEPRSGKIIPDFSSPYLELVRRLREAAEVEQALMLQYLYAAFSLKPAYLAVIASHAPGTVDLTGVAIQKMQHLVTVNRLLVALGVGPTLLQEEFPYALDVYPFECTLEPLSRKSLAKYLYAEAPAAVFAPNAPAPDRRLARKVMQALGRNTHTNHIGGLYDAVIASLKDCAASNLVEEFDTGAWLGRLHAIKSEGEGGHFNFFRSVFEAHPEGILGRTEAARAAPRKAATLVGHRNEIGTSALPALSRLGDLHYWSVLLLLDLHFREDGEKERYLELARMQMLGPVWSLARHLPKLGGGMPFHPLSLGYTPRADTTSNCLLAAEMLREAHVMAEKIGRALPVDYPTEMKAAVLRELEGMTRSSPRHPKARHMSSI
jgi:Ferritin-like